MNWETKAMCIASPLLTRIQGQVWNCYQFPGTPVDRIPNFTEAQPYLHYGAKNLEMSIRSTWFTQVCDLWPVA